MEQKDSSQSSGIAFVDISQELRQVRRASVQCRLTYSGVSSESLIIGEGTVVDLSQTGCGIQGNQQVEQGMRLTLCLHLSSANQPLRINEVQVMWIDGERFGVKSLDVAVHEQERLQDFVQSELAQETRKGAPVSFRLNLEKVPDIE